MIAVVPQRRVFVIERLGRYHRTLAAGLHFLAPVIDRVAFRFSLDPIDERLADNCITHDNVAVTITSTFRWQITDAQRAAYGSANINELVTGVVRSAQREWISARAWNEVRENTRELGAAVERTANAAADDVGVRISAFAVERIERAAN